MNKDRYLVFDCSAIGKPKRWNAPHTDTFNWPRMIHLAYRQYDDEYNLLDEGSDLVDLMGMELPYETARLSGIDQQMIDEEGRPVKEILAEFQEVIDESNYLFAFNMRFNFNVLAAAFYRAGIENRLFQLEKYCIMKESTYFCKLPGKDGRYKWPTLQELHQKVFGTKYENVNRADADVKAAADCLFKLIEMDEIDIFY